MYNFNLIFISGVHGVGKGHLCAQINEKMGLPIYSASSLIKEAKKREIDIDKKVIDPEENQDHLIRALRLLNIEHKTIILDGHFSLYDGNNIINIDIGVFQSMPIIGIISLYDTPYKIQNRLLERDKNALDICVIEKLQAIDLQQANIVSEKLQLPIMKCLSDNSLLAIRWIENLMSN